ncbi:conserved Plasmodium protein, unknown function [Plasmodium gallinaceum]|uniref:Uncharacterized protein n=1 Tax=Plasmodium gallinaceum TaxID=5849 RepID=A0A1J1GW36_PLAGA|nr:conserved Plasmodium protein, unknown function [Plasmodium gallinaceum]CRG96678.1 conserved Plasmodium protein, unknown function [Plasmodium gallinaceum]
MFYIYFINSPKFCYNQIYYKRTINKEKLFLINRKSFLKNIKENDTIRNNHKINIDEQKNNKKTRVTSYIFSKFSHIFNEKNNFLKRKNINFLENFSIHKDLKKKKIALLKAYKKKQRYLNFSKNYLINEKNKLKYKKVCVYNNYLNVKKNKNNNILKKNYSSEENSNKNNIYNGNKSKYYLNENDKSSKNVHDGYASSDSVNYILNENTLVENNTNFENKDMNEKIDNNTNYSFIFDTNDEYDPNKFLNVLYFLIEKKIDINDYIEKELNRRMTYFIKKCNDIKMIFLLLHTMNKLVCINNLINKLHDHIYKIQDSELLSIFVRILINSNYQNKNLLFFILNKLKENINLNICSTLTVSNAFYSYSTLYQRNLIDLEQIPLQQIIQIISNYYSSFSYIQLLEIVDVFQNFKFINKDTDKILYKSVSNLFYNIGNYFINNDIIKSLKFKNIKELMYSYAKNKIYHEKLFLYLYPPLLEYIRKLNHNIIRNKFYTFLNVKDSDKSDLNEKLTNKIKLDDSIKNEKEQKDIKNNLFHDDNKILNKNYELIIDASKNVTDILYSFSKFNMYIDELYNEVLLFMQNFYKYIDCSNMSQCLISFTKTNCNISMLLSKIHYDKFNVNSNYNNFFRYASSIDLMNFLLAFSRNLYFEKDVYNIISELLLKGKIYSLEASDLINIIHAYSKIYYIDEKLFLTVDNIICSRLDRNDNYLTTELAIKYLNACAKLSYKNEKIIYKTIEILHRYNFANIKIFDLFKVLKSIKKLNLSFESLESYIKMIAPNYAFDFSKYTNYYYKTTKDIHIRKKKWIW